VSSHSTKEKGVVVAENVDKQVKSLPQVKKRVMKKGQRREDAHPDVKISRALMMPR